jgi:hypothetical protein
VLFERPSVGLVVGSPTAGIQRHFGVQDGGGQTYGIRSASLAAASERERRFSRDFQ